MLQLQLQDSVAEESLIQKRATHKQSSIHATNMILITNSHREYNHKCVKRALRKIYGHNHPYVQDL